MQIIAIKTGIASLICGSQSFSGIQVSLGQDVFSILNTFKLPQPRFGAVFATVQSAGGAMSGDCQEPRKRRDKTRESVLVRELVGRPSL